eukprot:CAMPEP_0118883748 /NCGR_PEP_ID=MMETSP1163-20130328/22772_1 /TAXON_ID=124430 /ORGANISM="Phaeomonas parva, Strain CCMP2877" /LENGTH=53 /DNA_ID=CAMNT_0006821291 /DNA_START=1144 /DNA_END=1305 /DNA_ORIENTATION=+
MLLAAAPGKDAKPEEAPYDDGEGYDEQRRRPAARGDVVRLRGGHRAEPAQHRP